jgi:hypothetical protein
MASSTDDLYAKALELAAQGDEAFLELAKALRQLQDRDPELFNKAMQKAKLGRRKAYYLVDVSRGFDGLPIPKSRLRKVGWTKLGMMAKHVDKANVEEWIELAENHTTKQLETLLRGEEAPDNSHCVLMYFTPEQYAELEQILLRNGGARSGRGIQNKETALLRALKSRAQAEEERDEALTEAE